MTCWGTRIAPTTPLQTGMLDATRVTHEVYTSSRKSQHWHSPSHRVSARRIRDYRNAAGCSPQFGHLESPSHRKGEWVRRTLASSEKRSHGPTKRWMRTERWRMKRSPKPALCVETWPTVSTSMPWRVKAARPSGEVVPPHCLHMLQLLPRPSLCVCFLVYPLFITTTRDIGDIGDGWLDGPHYS